MVKYGAELLARVAQHAEVVGPEHYIDYAKLNGIIEGVLTKAEGPEKRWEVDFYEQYLVEVWQSAPWMHARPLRSVTPPTHTHAHIAITATPQVGKVKAFLAAHTFSAFDSHGVPENVVVEYLECNKVGLDKITKKFDKARAYLQVPPTTTTTTTTIVTPLNTHSPHKHHTARSNRSV